ncbi:hypothetical protein H6A07_01160 [Olsenella uli]|uniref:hypothetical protein n=1 Tax=Olsenella uli TaxID=133926 RepID=UPI00195B0D34|nr:hypothetical protein [Olsenella uli]MBM6675356.1 hypothetical protein [Olsenella uli]
MSEDERSEQHGRLGRLFAALVGTDPDATDAAGEKDRAPLAGTATGAGAGPSHLDLDALSASLAASTDPLRALRRFTDDVRGRAAGSGTGPAPSALETYLAERLQEAGIEDDEPGGAPTVRVVRPHTSGLFYLRISDEELPYPAKLRVLRTEAALNGALLASLALEDPDAASLEDLVRFEARCARSIVSQAPLLARRREGPARGEWEVRLALSEAIESARLPHRLTARYRVNVRDRRAAFEVDLVPPAAWPATSYVDGLGVVSATSEMRRRAASDYDLRLGVLLASYALLVAPELEEVWVAGVEDGPQSHVCRYSARLTRALLEGVDLEGSLDVWALMRAAGAQMDEKNLALEPVRPAFSLDDERLCPARRWEPVELSGRELAPGPAHELGAHAVRDLGVDEAAARRRAADELVRSLGETTEQNVRALLEAAEGAPDDVRDAALRCVGALIDGTLEDDPLAIVEAFVSGSPLERGVDRAREAFSARDGEEAEARAREALREADKAGRYADGDGLVWRSFATYADRVLYDRLVAPPGETCRLVPDAYLEGHLIVSACALARGDVGEALAHARLARELSPLSTQTSLHLAQCLEASGDARAAADELRRLLALAHDPETVGIGYLRMAQLQWQEGHVLAAQACYQLACNRLGAPVLVAGLAVVALIGHVSGASESSLTAEQVERALAAEDIPLAPTEEVTTVLMEASRAAVDAELFGVGRDVVRSLCSSLRDDVLFGVLRSLEDEPDR